MSYFIPISHSITHNKILSSFQTNSLLCFTLKITFPLKTNISYCKKKIDPCIKNILDLFLFTIFQLLTELPLLFVDSNLSPIGLSVSARHKSERTSMDNLYKEVSGRIHIFSIEASGT